MFPAQATLGQGGAEQGRPGGNGGLGRGQKTGKHPLDRFRRRHLKMLAGVIAAQEIRAAMGKDDVARPQDAVRPGRERQGVLALDAENGQVQGRTQAAFGQGAAVQGRPGGDADGDDMGIELVGRAQGRAVAGRGGRSPLGEQAAAQKGHEDDARRHDGRSDRGEVENGEGSQPGVLQGVGHQDVGRGGDAGEGTAQKAAQSQGHEQPGGGTAAAPGQLHGRRQEDGGHGHGVDQGRQQAGHGHQDHDEHNLAPRGEILQRPADLLGHAGTRQPGGQDEQRPHRDHGRAAESGQRLLGGDQPCQGQGRQDQKAHKIHTDPSADEQDQRRADDGQKNSDIKRQETSSAGCRIVSRFPPRMKTRLGQDAVMLFRLFWSWPAHARRNGIWA
ncbi:hypothetical protein ASZ90_002034 [hydrocarbon metagenome]|uniref:Uncharacterized protein n=1 Tax=hydrocarbon metagenome TaxID=938273 RepID=A0A0W8G502_9ZZZZ